jgi:hypothetical protein
MAEYIDGTFRSSIGFQESSFSKTTSTVSGPDFRGLPVSNLHLRIDNITFDTNGNYFRYDSKLVVDGAEPMHIVNIGSGRCLRGSGPDGGIIISDCEKNRQRASPRR